MKSDSLGDYAREAFEALPLITRVRELREITGGSTTCGWMTQEGAWLLYTMIKWYKPEIVIQTGHLWGMSSLITAEALNDGFLMGSYGLEDRGQNVNDCWEAFIAVNSPGDAVERKAISLDPKPINVPDPNAGVEFIEGHHPGYTFLKMPSGDFFEEAESHLGSDVAGKRLLGIVDGDHSWMGCMTDLEGFRELGADMIFVDDISWLPHLSETCRLFARRWKYQYFDFTSYSGVGILLRQGAIPEHVIDGDYAGLPWLGAWAYRIGGWAFVDRLFAWLKKSRGCTITGNRLTVKPWLTEILPAPVLKVIWKTRARFRKT